MSTDPAPAPTVGATVIFGTVLVVAALVALGAYSWWSARRDAMAAAEAERLRVEEARRPPSIRTLVRRLEDAHPTTAPRDRLIEGIRRLEAGSDRICLPIVVSAQRAYWFSPTAVDELTLLILATEPIDDPIVELRDTRRPGEATRQLSRPRHVSRQLLREPADFLLRKYYFLPDMTDVAEESVTRPSNGSQSDSTSVDPHNEWKFIQVRVRASPTETPSAWVSVAVLTDASLRDMQHRRQQRARSGG